MEVQLARDVGALGRNVVPQGRREHDGLEGTPGLPPGVESQIELALLPRQSPYGPRLGLHGDHGGGRIVGIGKHLLGRLHGRVLEVGIHRGVDPEPPALQRFRSELLFHVAPDLFEEGRVGGVLRRWVGGEVQGRGLRLLKLFARDHALFVHEPEYPVTPLASLRHYDLTLPGHISGGGVQKTGERGRFGEVEVFRALAEIGFGRSLRPVGAVPEVHGVQVGGEDLVFGVVAFVGERQSGLDEAPAEGGLEALVLGHVEVLHELLRERGAALLDVPGPEVGPRCAGESLWVKTPVVVEAPVLDGDDGLGQVVAEAVEPHGLAALGDGELPYLLPVHIVDVGVLGQLGVGPVEVALKLLGYEEVEAGDHDHGAYSQDQSEVEEGAQPPNEASQRALLRFLLAGFEEVVQGPPAVVYPNWVRDGKRADDSMRACLSWTAQYGASVTTRAAR